MFINEAIISLVVIVDRGPTIENNLEQLNSYFCQRQYISTNYRPGSFREIFRMERRCGICVILDTIEPVGNFRSIS